MEMFPLFLKLEGRPCLLVGAGRVGEGKLKSLLRAGARVKVVAPKATAGVQRLAKSAEIVWRKRKFTARDLDGMFLVVAATSSHPANAVILEEARRRGVLCNAVDDPRNCDFYYPAVLRRGSLQIAISTGGSSPELASRLRKELESCFGSRVRVLAGPPRPPARRVAASANAGRTAAAPPAAAHLPPRLRAIPPQNQAHQEVNLRSYG